MRGDNIPFCVLAHVILNYLSNNTLLWKSVHTRQRYSILNTIFFSPFFRIVYLPVHYIKALNATSFPLPSRSSEPNPNMNMCVIHIPNYPDCCHKLEKTQNGILSSCIFVNLTLNYDQVCSPVAYLLLYKVYRGLIFVAGTCASTHLLFSNWWMCVLVNYQLYCFKINF